jgi:hypothetical protein
MNRRLLIILLTIVIFIVGAILVFERTQTPDWQCGSPAWHATYIGWDDNAGPCTYLQRVAFDSFYALAFPFLFVFPATIAMIVYFIVQLAVRRSLRRVAYKPILIAAVAILSLWFVAMAALQIASQR